MFFAVRIALPLGVIAAFHKKTGGIILGVTGVLQTIPSLALLVFMIPLLGIGENPAIVALFLYSLLPIVRNTESGLRDIPQGIRDSAEVIGLSPAARLFHIYLPLASRSILGGIKTATVINIGTATLGALIGAGGYGQPILTGIRLDDMGLILEGERFAVLSDILGDEDHLGDMDFKVAGTEDGITSLQMDIKITGITEEIMSTALFQAKDGRMHILSKMGEALGVARPGLGEYAPRIEVMHIPTDKIRDVIGTGGKVIREIVEKTEAKIDISDDGTIKVASSSGASIEAAMDWIKSIVSEPEVGVIYDGKVVKVVDFGAFVNFFGAKDGLVHISELAPQRVGKVTDIVNEGDMVKVKLVGFDNRGKVRLSMKLVDQETGADLSKKDDDAGDQENAG